MRNGPILRGPRAFPPGSSLFGEGVAMILTVYGGLHYLLGNTAPYFSLTYWAHRRGHPNQCESGGAGHDLILRLYPELQDLADLHLSDVDGVPMHAEANGWYQLAGAMGGAGERYHAGSGAYGKTEDECLAAFARHCRITVPEAQAIRARAISEHAAHDDWEWSRAYWKRELEAMRPRWKQEAEACILRHGLRVYGDPWQREEVSA